MKKADKSIYASDLQKHDLKDWQHKEDAKISIKNVLSKADIGVSLINSMLKALEKFY